MDRTARTCLIPLIVAFAAGCSSPGASPDDGKLRVVATTSIIADAAQAVGGDRVRVDCLLGRQDPHRYMPSTQDASRLAEADVVFFHGLHLEGKMTDLLEKPRAGQRRRAVTDALDHATLRSAEAGADGPHDPHVWFDPRLWVECVHLIGEELAAADPAGADGYRQRAAEYAAAVRAADAEMEAVVAQLPPARRVLVTSHDAFGYFGAHYGFRVRGLQGVSTASETGTRDRADLADFLGKNKVPAVFAETSVPPKGLEAVLDTVRAEHKHAVRLIGGDDALYSDALGEPGTPGETYVGMLRHNVTTIVNALEMTPAVEVHDLTVAYREKPALWDVDLSVPPGVLMAVVGPNGAGKTTLLKAMLGLIRPVSGRVFVLGKPYAENRKAVAYVPQRGSVDWDFPTTVSDLVLMGTYGRLGWIRRPGPAERKDAAAALAQVGLADLGHRQIGQLSGGQQQRAFLARALVQHADVYVLDEPFQGVDALTERAVVELLRGLRAAGKTVLVVHHDLATVPEYFDHVTLLNVRLIASGPTAEVFTRRT